VNFCWSMAEITCLSSCCDWLKLDFVERERPPSQLMKLGIRLHLAGQSLSRLCSNPQRFTYSPRNYTRFRSSRSRRFSGLLRRRSIWHAEQSLDTFRSSQNTAIHSRSTLFCCDSKFGKTRPIVVCLTNWSKCHTSVELLD